MISPDLSVREFCEKMTGRIKQDIIRVADQEANMADAKNRSAKGKGSTHVHAAYREYISFLGKLLNILRYDGVATFTEKEMAVARPMLEGIIGETNGNST